MESIEDHGDGRADPGRVVFVEDYDAPTVRAVIQHLEMSTTLDHVVYREAEMDALYSRLEVAVRHAETVGAPDWDLQKLRRLLELAHEAHDLVGVEDTYQAAQRLRKLLVLVE